MHCETSTSYLEHVNWVNSWSGFILTIRRSFGLSQPSTVNLSDSPDEMSARADRLFALADELEALRGDDFDFET